MIGAVVVYIKKILSIILIAKVMKSHTANKIIREKYN